MRIIIILAIVTLSLSAYAESNPNCTSGTLYTEDNITIAYEQYKNEFDSVIVVCPGFYNSMENRWMRKTVDLLLSEHDVIIFDLRGHGKSTGKYSWGAREHLDINAILDYAKLEGYKKIGILAFSLGAASSINAVSERDDVDSMILISCPSSFKGVNFHFWEPGMLSDLKDNIDCKWEGKGARVDHIFLPKKKPIDTITLVKRTPMFFIHGDKDWIIKDYHSETLYNAAPTYKKIEIIENGLHAERLVQFYPDKLRKLILDWFDETLDKS
ncbi:MAG: alpha/beta fold hydrolase [Candidatus Omnitrophica bacterium]|nr:alpha/beta fold hydrolase [Candidatus Omnitrophota bacterium]